jgi:hypothetical protein
MTFYFSDFSPVLQIRCEEEGGEDLLTMALCQGVEKWGLKY